MREIANAALTSLMMMLALGCASGHCRSQYAEPGDHKQTSEESLRAAFPNDSSTRLPASDATIRIFKSDESKQCEHTKGIGLEEMEKELKGIKVLSRAKGHDNMMHASSCGSDTGIINIYEIPLTDWSKAEKLQFRLLKLDPTE